MLFYEGVPVFEEVAAALESKPECIVPVQVKEELERIASHAHGFRKRRAALMALSIIANNCRIVDSRGDSGDDAIVYYVISDCESVPVTADRELRRRLREKGIPHLYYKAERRGFILEE